MNNLRKTHHTTYDAMYHLVWSPKRRRHIERTEVRKTIEDTIKEIALNHNIDDRRDQSKPTQTLLTNSNA